MIKQGRVVMLPDQQLTEVLDEGEGDPVARVLQLGLGHLHLGQHGLKANLAQVLPGVVCHRAKKKDPHMLFAVFHCVPSSEAVGLARECSPNKVPRPACEGFRGGGPGVHPPPQGLAHLQGEAVVLWLRTLEEGGKEAPWCNLK